MARYRRSDGHYADVECAYADFERYLVLSCAAPRGSRVFAQAVGW
jgi:hypothetical protein